MCEVWIMDSTMSALQRAPLPQPLYGYQSLTACVVVSTEPHRGLVEVGVATAGDAALGEMSDGVVRVIVGGDSPCAEVSAEGVWVPVTLEPLSTRRDLQARNEGLVPTTTLSQSKVVVFGVGSIGGQISRLLVQAGVPRVTLVDPDVFAPTNVSRHVLDLSSVGEPKVDALAAALLRINPELEVTPLQMGVGPTTLAKAVAALSGATLAVIATDSVEANRAAQLASIVAQVPVVAVGCWDRAEAAEIIYADPANGTPCYGCLRAALPVPTSSRNSAAYMLADDSAPPNVGLAVDVAFVATVAAKVCLAVVTQDTEVGLVTEEFTVLLLSTRPGGIFSAACQVAPVRAERDADCWLCSHLHTEARRV